MGVLYTILANFTCIWNFKVKIYCLLNMYHICMLKICENSCLLSSMTIYAYFLRKTIFPHFTVCRVKYFTSSLDIQMNLCDIWSIFVTSPWHQHSVRFSVHMHFARFMPPPETAERSYHKKYQVTHLQNYYYKHCWKLSLNLFIFVVFFTFYLTNRGICVLSRFS